MSKNHYTDAYYAPFITDSHDEEDSEIIFFTCGDTTRGSIVVNRNDLPISGYRLAGLLNKAFEKGVFAARAEMQAVLGIKQ